MDPMAGTVERAKGGDRAAFEEIYRAFSRPLFLYLAACLRRREDAEDAFQAAFLSAWRHLPSLADAERFSPWLFRIARNAARDATRRRRLRPSPLGPAEDLIAGGAEPSASASEVPRLLADLHPETRALVLLRAVEGWSAEEVGAAFSWSAATVRRRYARALELLKARQTGRNGHEALR